MSIFFGPGGTLFPTQFSGGARRYLQPDRMHPRLVGVTLTIAGVADIGSTCVPFIPGSSSQKLTSQPSANGTFNLDLVQRLVTPYYDADSGGDVVKLVFGKKDAPVPADFYIGTGHRQIFSGDVCGGSPTDEADIDFFIRLACRDEEWDRAHSGAPYGGASYVELNVFGEGLGGGVFSSLGMDWADIRTAPVAQREVYLNTGLLGNGGWPYDDSAATFSITPVFA